MNRAMTIGIALLLLPACDDFDWFHIYAHAPIDQTCAIDAAAKDGFVFDHGGSQPTFGTWQVAFKSDDRMGGPSMARDDKGRLIVGWFGPYHARPTGWAHERASRLSRLMRDVYRQCAPPPLPSSLPIACDMRHAFQFLSCPGHTESQGSCDTQVQNQKSDCPGQLQLADPAPSTSASTGEP